MPTVSAGGYVRSIAVRTRVSCYAAHDVLPPMIETRPVEADEIEAIE
jgi:hypothetical protein